METTKTFENYPLWIVIQSSLVSFGIYISGLLITYRLGWIFAAIYLGYILTLEFRLLRYHCTGCYYWGKTCGFGKGRISALFFKKGDPPVFCNNNFTWKEMIPDLLVSLIPLIVGLVLLIIEFDLILLIALIVLTGLTTAGNGYITG